MENREPVSGNNEKRNAGNIPNPIREPASPPEKPQKNFDSEPNRPDEINPGKLDKEEIDLDHTEVDNSQGHEPYEFKNQQGGDQAVSGQGSSEKGNLMGQGGYGSSGTNSTNSQNPQVQKGKSSAGSQDGSSGSKTDSATRQ